MRHFRFETCITIMVNWLWKLLVIMNVNNKNELGDNITKVHKSFMYLFNLPFIVIIVVVVIIFQLQWGPFSSLKCHFAFCLATINQIIYCHKVQRTQASHKFNVDDNANDTFLIQFTRGYCTGRSVGWSSSLLALWPSPVIHTTCNTKGTLLRHSSRWLTKSQLSFVAIECDGRIKRQILLFGKHDALNWNKPEHCCWSACVLCLEAKHKITIKWVGRDSWYHYHMKSLSNGCCIFALGNSFESA